MSRVLSYKYLFETLNRTGCGFVVVGGLAVILHGHARLTTDTDLVVDLASDSVDNLLNAFTELGFVPRIPVNLSEFADAQKRNLWIAEKHIQAFPLFHPEQPGWVIDLIIDLPVSYEALAAHAEIKQIEGVDVAVAAIDDLIRMKRLADRDIDRQDIEFLQQIRELQADYRTGESIHA